jgi:hypothetical protein
MCNVAHMARVDIGIVYSCLLSREGSFFFSMPTFSLLTHTPRRTPHVIDPINRSKLAAKMNTTANPDTARIQKKLMVLNKRLMAILAQVGASDVTQQLEFQNELQRDVVSKSIFL